MNRMAVNKVIKTDIVVTLDCSELVCLGVISQVQHMRWGLLWYRMREKNLMFFVGTKNCFGKEWTFKCCNFLAVIHQVQISEQVYKSKHLKCLALAFWPFLFPIIPSSHTRWDPKEREASQFCSTTRGIMTPIIPVLGVPSQFHKTWDGWENLVSSG